MGDGDGGPPCHTLTSSAYVIVYVIVYTIMAFTTKDIVPLSHARSHFSELAEEVHAGAEKIITKNGESYVALVDAARLDYYHRLEAERGQLSLLQDLERGLDDVRAGRVSDAATALKRMKAQRARK